ncbi:hypothetical protein B296_00027060 [Ensete ventricosum]|uniref:Uncharacterized protein n=1 Tax=Ensete ventricosum TaxID=4639 RepID=A0A426ZJA1_ENSVE|nr:hypothetical protein B296_00027060 [Ensete ventricosum]
MELKLGRMRGPRSPALEVDCWSGRARGRVEVPQLGSIADSCKKVGSGRFPTGVDLTCVRSTVRPLMPPYLRQTGFPRRVGHIGGPVARGREDVAARSTSAISFFPPGKTFSRCPIRVLKMRSCAKLPACGEEPAGLHIRELIRPSRSSRTDQTERSSGEELAGLRVRELIRPSRSSGTDRTEHSSGEELIELHVQELIRPNQSSRTDRTERSSGEEPIELHIRELIRPSQSSGTDQTERSSREELAKLRIRELIRPSQSSGTDRTERSSGEELVGLRIRELIRPSRSSGTELGILPRGTRAQILGIWPRGRTRAQILGIWPRGRTPGLYLGSKWRTAFRAFSNLPS